MVSWPFYTYMSEKEFNYMMLSTKKAIEELYKNYQYIADPHGAVGYLGLKDYLNEKDTPHYGVFLETAHPVKFLDVVESTLSTEVPLPKSIQKLMTKEKLSQEIQNYEDLKSYLMQS